MDVNFLKIVINLQYPINDSHRRLEVNYDILQYPINSKHFFLECVLYQYMFLSYNLHEYRLKAG